MYQLTDSAFVIRISDGAHIPDDPSNADRREYVAWLSAGNVPEPLPPQAVTIADYVHAIETHVDATATAKAYGGTASLASYVNSSVPAWAAEAAAFVAWRDAVWLYAYAEMAKVQAAQRAQPTVAELIAELPVIQWPA
jgi:hypothetical protein